MAVQYRPFRSVIPVEVLAAIVTGFTIGLATPIDREIR